MKYFTAKNLEELRKEYKKLMVKNHPDNGGDVVRVSGNHSRV